MSKNRNDTIFQLGCVMLKKNMTWEQVCVSQFEIKNVTELSKFSFHCVYLQEELIFRPSGGTD